MGSDDASTPYVLAVPAIAAAVLPVQPLRAGHATNPYNKVAWVVLNPVHGAQLKIDASPLDQSGRGIAFDVEPAYTQNGIFYPSALDLPTAGCWSMTLLWTGHSARVDLEISHA